MDQRTQRQAAGKKGGLKTKESQATGYYQRIGAQGGTTTMREHAAEYVVHRKRGGEQTKERYGEEHYRELAQKSSATRQERTKWRNAAIQKLIENGYKIPTIIQLTLDDLPRLEPICRHEIARYLQSERPLTASRTLFVSQSGQPLSLANTYSVMRRFQQNSP